MKKLFFIPLIFICLFQYSCEEGCDDTIAPQKSNSISSAVLVIDQDGNSVVDYPVWVEYQKRWCEGDWAIVVSNSGVTNNFGHYYANSPLYDLSNEEDYILVRYLAGPGENKLEYSERATYSEFGSVNLEKNHTFEIVQ